MIAALVQVFDRFADAEAAHAALIEAGISPERLQLTALQDEAGPPQGNFVSGDGRGKDEHFVGDYDKNFAQVEYRGAQMLTVAPASEDERRSAAALMARFGGMDPDARLAPAGMPSRT